MIVRMKKVCVDFNQDNEPGSSRQPKLPSIRALGVDFKNNKTAKQQFHQEYSCFLDEHFISTKRKEVKFCFSPSLVQKNYKY